MRQGDFALLAPTLSRTSVPRMYLKPLVPKVPQGPARRWRAGVLVGLGRKRAAVAIEAAGLNRLVVAKSYNRLRRRR